MAVVTINGTIGSGGNEVGVLVARLLEADYVDRLILAQAAKRIGSTVEVLQIKEQRKLQFRDRITYFFQTMLERSAMSGGGGDPYFSPGMEYILSEEYTDLAQEPVTAAQRLNDQKFIDVTSAVVKDLAAAGNVIIIGRGSNMILKGAPGVFHVALIAPLEQRIQTIAEREHLDRKDAEKFIADMEKARVIFYRKFFKVDPDDPKLNHIMLDLGVFGIDTAAEIVANAAQKLTSPAEVEVT